jgi:hypothetical protein
MRPSTERALMGLLLAGLPVLLYLLLIRPSLRRNQALHQRIQAAQAAFANVPPFTPVGQAERAFLAAPQAPWRSRIATVADDGSRLEHVNRVVREVSAVMRANGVRVTAIRAILDPVSADFTLAAPWTEAPAAPKVGTDAPEYQLKGWVLELEIDGAAGELFKAVSALSGLNALMEPVGLRWEAAQATDPGKARHHQFLLLRNLYLKP